MFVRRTLLVIFGLFCAVSASAITYTWNGGTAAWNVGTNWTPTRAAVANTDVLVFNGGGATTANAVPTETIGQILVTNNTNVTLQSAGAVTVTINGLAGTDLQVDAGSQLNFAGTANAITMNIVAGQTGSISGSMTLSGTASVAHRLTAASASGITFQSGSTFTQGTNHNGNVFGAGTANSVVFASGSTFNFQSGSNPFALGQPASVVVYQTGSLYRQQSSNAPSFSGRTYANFEMVSGTASPTGGSAVVMDNLTVTGGTLNWGMTGTPGHAIKGNISIAAAGTLNFNPASAGTLNLNGGASQSITNAGTLTLNSANQTINIANAAGITLGSNITFQQGALTLTSGNISTGANTLIINSGASVARPGTGHVIGNLRKDFAANGSKVFEVGTANGYSPFTANVTAGTPGNIICAAVQGAQPNMNAATSIARYWQLTATAGITADLTFQYLAGDVNGNEAAYQVFRVSGGVPVNFPASVVNTGTHTATLAGVNTFSDWTVGEAGGPPPTPTLNVGDVTLSEGDPPGTTTFNFSVTLTAPAGAGGVSFTWQTADGTATLADNDYVQVTPTAGSIASGNSSTTLSVTVNRDLTPEANETFFVNVSGVTNATAGDTQGQGTINNDDVALTLIHTVQGDSSITQTSPIVGSSVTIDGIVTGVKSNGFFVQEEDADADANPNTSEGVFVFTSSAPPAAAAFTARVRVTGTVSEFVPSADPQQPPLTELSGSLTITQMAPAGQTLPTPITLTPTNPDPAGTFNQMEKYEGMRVTAASMTVSGPSDGSVNESAATGTSNGRFHAVVTGVAKPFREPGIQAPDLPPTGTIPPIPRWDTNPENLRVESATINSQPVLTVRGNDVVGPIQGPLDYSFRGYAIYPDGTLGTPVVTPGTLNTIVTTPLGAEFTVASFNLERFFDTTDDPESDAVLTAGAFANRLQKASIAIRNHLKFPDIVGVQEMEHLSTLQALATQINNDAVANAQPNPQYVAFLVEGNDVGGIDVGYLVKTAPVPGGAPRVAVNSVTQVGAATTYIDPTTGNPATLNDRPPLVLDATVNRAPGVSFNVIIINNHLRSLLSLTDETVSGPTTVGDRVRRKRQLQADFLAQYIQGRLTTTPGEHIIVIGDMNNFEFNDGYQDSLDTIAGTPVPDNETVVCSTCPQAPNTGDGIDQVFPANLTNLVNTPPPPERYSYNFDGNAQNIDHAVVSPGLITDTSARRIEHPRIDADYPETERNTNTTAFRISDHDPIVAYFAPLGFTAADLSITKTDSPDPVNAGSNLTYTITVDNSGPDPATTASWSDTIPAGTTFVSISSVAGWSCSDPGVGNNGLVSCSNPSFAVGSAVFTLVVHVAPSVAAGTVLSNTATATSPTNDPDSADLSATETTTVSASADLQISKTDSPDPVNAGSNLTYQLTLTNNGPSNAASATFSDTLPAGTTFVSLSTTGTWSCTDPGVGNNGTVSCTNTSFGVTVDFFTLVVHVNANVAAGTVLSNTATIGSATTDPNTGNESDTATTTVATSADLSVTKTDTPDPVNAGNQITYTVTVTNAGPSNATNVTLTDTTPPGTTFAFLAAPGAWVCPVPPSGGPVVCTHSSLPVGTSVFTIKVIVDPSTAAGTVLTNTVTVTSASDPNSANDSDSVTTTVASSADLSITKTDTPDPVNAGNQITYTVTVTNAGPSNAANVTLTDTTPPGTTFAFLAAPGAWVCPVPPSGGPVVCTHTSLPVGTSVFTIKVIVDPSTAAGTVLTNTATLTSSSSDPNTGNESASATTTVATSADLSLSKTDSPDPVIAGNNLTYQLTLTNSGPSNATSATFSDTLPAGTTFVSLSTTGSWSCTTPAVGANGTVSCTNTNFGVTVDFFTLVVKVDPSVASGTVLSNTGSLASSTSDPNGANNNSTATTTVSTQADMSITKTDIPDPVTAGSNLTYTITVTNNGPSNAANVNMSDTLLPVGTRFVSLSSPGGWSCTAPPVNTVGTISCTIATLAPGSAVFTLVVSVEPQLATGTVISNTATTSTTTTDPNGANDSATATTTVGVGMADLSITKNGPTGVSAGTDLTYSIGVTNNGPTDATSASVSDTLPAGTTFVSMSSSAGWSCTTPAVGGTGLVNCTNPTFAAGGFASFTLTVHVDPALASGTVISNTASTTSATTDPNASNNNATWTTTSSVNAILAVTKGDSPDPVAAGANITYALTVTNAGPSNAAPGTLFDTVPANTTFVSMSAPAGWSCTTPAVGGTGDVTCTHPSFGGGATANFTLVVNVNPGTPNGTVITNAAVTSPGAGSAETTTTVQTSTLSQVTATKSATTSGAPGTPVTYTVVITNNMTHAQGDNPGNEFLDVLPAQLTLVSATATSGTAVATVATNTVTWNGSLAANGGSVTITINATINANATGTISNQGTVFVDLDDNGTNESSFNTDAPGGAANDPTTFAVISLSDVPTLSEWMLFALAALLGLAAMMKMRS